MLQKGKPIPEDLVPLRPEVTRGFVDLVLAQVDQNEFRNKVNRIQADWRLFDAETKLKILNSFYDVVFARFFPRPDCKTTYNRVDATALFRANLWAMYFTEGFLNSPFDQVFKTWLHENYHAFLHFLSLRLDPALAAEAIGAPLHVISTAKKYPLSKNDLVPVTFAKRNLIGTMDRALGTQAGGGRYRAARIGDQYISISSVANPMAGTGWDSYYLNVEINVENITELTFRRLLPNAQFRRSYRSAEEYIKLRMEGVAPVYAR